MRLHGKVVRGLGIGKKLGYPTANLEISGDLVSDASATKSPHIAPGVYAAEAIVDDATHHAAVIVGARHSQGRPLIEVFLLDFKSDLYGKELAVEVLDKVSDIADSKDETELRRKIEDDVKKVRLCLQGSSQAQAR